MTMASHVSALLVNVLYCTVLQEGDVKYRVRGFNNVQGSL